MQSLQHYDSQLSKNGNGELPLDGGLTRGPILPWIDEETAVELHLESLQHQRAVLDAHRLLVGVLNQLDHQAVEVEAQYHRERCTEWMRNVHEPL
ncbi:MAG: hypothetical protein Q7R81_06350 [Candidatus Peregrinibacteria bacterium]|nr:hypothetical protein [Candidatus Peregrinibacteria bacterium]